MSDETPKVAETPAKADKAAKVSLAEKGTTAAAAKAVAVWQCPEKVGTNALALPWPIDPHGSMKALKDGAVASIKRINGDEVKYKQFVGTMKVIMKYAEEKTAVAAEARKKARVNAVSASKRVAEKQKDAALGQVQALEKQIAAIKSNYSLEAKTEDK